jgi:hypothetical protein
MGKTVVRITLLLLALVAIGVGSSATGNQRQVGGFVAQQPSQSKSKPALPPQAQTGHRHIPFGVSITPRLEPGDALVEVVRSDRSFIDFHNKDAEQEVESLMTTASAVAVVVITRKESAFHSIVEPEDWIRTTLTAEVKTVLKDPTGQLTDGGLIEIQESGGEVVLPDGRRIIARSEYNRLSKVGGTYLAALALDKATGRFLFNGRSSIEFGQGKVKRMRLDAPPNTDLDTALEQKSPEWIIQRARVLAERRQQ